MFPLRTGPKREKLGEGKSVTELLFMEYGFSLGLSDSTIYVIMCFTACVLMLSLPAKSAIHIVFGYSIN